MGSNNQKGVEKLIARVQAFAKHAGAARLPNGEVKCLIALPPAVDGSDVKRVYRVLSRYSVCNCEKSIPPEEQVRHLVRLLLPIPTYHDSNTQDKGCLQWQFLFSTRPETDRSKSVSWQDLGLRILP